GAAGELRASIAKGRPRGRPLPCGMPGLTLHSVADGVLGLADFALNLADGLVGLAFGLQLAITDKLAGGILDGALDLLAGTFDTILVQPRLLGFAVAPTTEALRQRFRPAK